MPVKKILAISGSLRTGSSNAALLQAAAALAPPDLAFTFYEGLGDLPHFNPDLDGEGAVPPEPVHALRELLRAADGLMLSVPEYAHGIPGSFKNALDWIVSSGELEAKPTLLVSASPSGAPYMHPALIEVLRVLMADVLEASMTAPTARRALDAQGRVIDPEFTEKLRAAVEALAEAVRVPKDAL